MTQPVAASADQQERETYNPWSVVNVVFHHLAAQGLHPVLGEAGDPGEPGRGPAQGLRHSAGRGGQPAGGHAHPG